MRFLPAAVALLALSAATPSRASDDSTGELRCTIAGGIGILVAGKRATSCIYYRHDGRVEFYIGSFTRFGFDVGPTQARSAAFKVLAREPVPPGVLDGVFMGAGAGDTIGRGVAADVLVGGRGETVEIVPIANSRVTGVNANVGIGSLNLRYAGTESRRERYRTDKPEDFGF